MEYLAKNEEGLCARLTCRCTAVEDSLDLAIYDNYPQVEVSGVYTVDSFWGRVRVAWKFIWNKWRYTHSIVIREEDYPAIIEFFQEAERLIKKWKENV